MRFVGKTSGFNELSALLKELPVQVENNVLQRATINAMRAGLPEMKNAAPTHKSDERSPASKKYGTIKQNLRVVRKKLKDKNKKAARITTRRAFWAFFYEIGTRNQAARPWFAPTFRSIEDKIFNVLRVEIANGIEKVASKYKGGRK